MLQGHGNDISNYKYNVLTDFSSNIWYKPLNSKLLNYLSNNLHTIINYPPADAINLQEKIAKNNCLCIKQVCVTSGATEAFYLISHAFKGCKSAIIAPSFSEYADAASLFNHHVEYFINDFKFNQTSFVHDLVWIGNPNNPDGKVISLKEIELFLQNNPKTVFIIDEAYGDLCLGFESALSLINKYNNLIIVKSVTKFCSIPGLRLGYILGCEELIEKVANCRMPWSVSTLALEAGLYIFDNYSDFKIDLNKLHLESKSFQTMLKNNTMAEVFPSNTNYFLVKLKDKKASDVKEFLLKEHGFLIRDCSNFYGLNESYFRLAVQGDENNKACAGAINQFFQQ